MRDHPGQPLHRECDAAAPVRAGALRAGFDAEITLRELFDAADRMQWEGWLSAQAGSDVSIVAPDAAGPEAAVLHHELEPLLALVTAPPGALTPALRSIFEAHVRERIRYRLACALQTDASAHDYAALQASEARYRGLAQELEHRVRTQVADLERARVYAFQAEHLRAVAQLAAGMAHEINNPLAFIASNLRSAQGYLEELRHAAADAGLVDDFHALLAETVEGVSRVAAIVGQLRVFSQVDAPRIAATEPRILVDAAVALLAGEVPQGVFVRVAGQPRTFVCEAAALSQALLQVLRNALQAMAGRQGTVDVVLSESGATLVVEVRDTGCGMTVDVLQRACDPFYSTRDVGQGVGLGLAVAAEVARRHNGSVELLSSLAEGTRVILTLRESAPPVAEHAGGPAGVHGRHESHIPLRAARGAVE